MFIRPFEYLQAHTVQEASTLLRARGSDAKILAGGQSLMPMINLGLAQVDTVVDISSIAALDYVKLEDGILRIGALTRHRTLESDDTVGRAQPLLSAVVRHVGNIRVRNFGTLGGSLAHNDPSAELPLAMQILEATCTVSNGNATRSISADAFFISYFTTALEEDELLVSLLMPALQPGWGWGFHEYSVRAGDFAIVAAASLVHCQDNVIKSVRVGLAGVGDKAVRLRGVEDRLTDASCDNLGDVPALVQAEITPMTDTFASADYRRHLAGVLATRAVDDACRRSMEGM